MNKGSIKNALAASLSAEESSFKNRLAKAEAMFGESTASAALSVAPALPETLPSFPVAETPQAAATAVPEAPPETSEAVVTTSAIGTPQTPQNRRKAARPGKATAAPALATGRVIRDSFTMPEKDYDLIGEIRTRCLGKNLMVNKSEVMRAGLQALCEMSDEQLATLMRSLEKVKTGRPAQT